MADIRVLVDARWISAAPSSSHARYLRALTAQWATLGDAAFITLVGVGPRPSNLPTSRRLQWLNAPDLPGPLQNRPGGRLWLNTVFTAVSAAHRPDVLFFPWSVLPRFPLAPVVVTVHDVCFRAMPELFADGGRSGDAQLRSALRRASAIVAPSAASKRGIVEAYRVQPERVTVVRHGIDAVFQSQAEADDLERRSGVGVPARYFLCVSTHEERKNLRMLVQAYTALWDTWREPGEPPALVFVGQTNAYTGQLRQELARSARAARHTHFLDVVSDSALAALYRGATALLLPSVCEGFGFPLVEALACGTPALVSELEVFQELAGPAATYVPASEVAAWTAHLTRAALVSPGRISDRDVSPVATLNWATSARQTLDIFKRVARRSEQSVGSRDTLARAAPFSRVERMVSRSGSFPAITFRPADPRRYWRGTRPILRSAIRFALRPVGFDLIRLYRMPRSTFVGLRRYPIRSIIDVGANRGQFAREARAAFPRARIECFEPLPQAFAALQDWAAEHPNTVSAVNVALGDTEGVVKMQVHVDWDFSSSLLSTTVIAHETYPQQIRQRTIDVPLTTLDAYFGGRVASIEPDIIIKIDAQGYDDRVIRGGRSVFKVARACIVEVNLDQLYQDQATFKTIFQLLDELGYRYAGNLDQTYGSDGHVVFVDAVFIR